MKLLYFLLFLPVLIKGQQLVYTPINPSFGGNSYNYSWMMTEADAQNKFTSSSSSKATSTSSSTTLDDFKASLNRQILSQLSRQIVSETFGETEFQEGTYEIGDYQINITNDLDGVNINILDTSNGSETSILIPYF